MASDLQKQFNHTGLTISVSMLSLILVNFVIKSFLIYSKTDSALTNLLLTWIVIHTYKANYTSQTRLSKRPSGAIHFKIHSLWSPTVPAPIMDALEKEPLLINSRKNQDKKIFFEYKPLLNISRTNNIGTLSF